jgi:hypothetical protein
MGSRIVVRSYVRRYLKALYKEIGDWQEEHAERSSCLLLYSICYVEDFMTQYLDHLLLSMYKASLIDNNKLIQKNITTTFRMIGRYCLPKSYNELIVKAIRNELAGFYSFTAQGSLKSYGHLFAGSIELLQPGMDLSRVYDTLRDFVTAVKETVVPSIDIESANYLLESLEAIITEVLKKKEEGVDVSIIKEHLSDFLDFLLAAQSAYMTYQL